MRLKDVLSGLLGGDVNIAVQVQCRTLPFGSNKSRYSICPDRISSDSVVYSFGVGNDISFDLALIERFGVNVHAFDPTPKAIEWLKKQDLPAEFRFHDYGIGPEDGVIRFSPPKDPKHFSYTALKRAGKKGLEPVEAKVYRLQTIMHMLDHAKIDILKVDIEGLEYQVIRDMIASEIDVDQFVVEFHHRFRNVPVRRTLDAIDLLNKHGFRIFDVSEKGHEYAFIRTKMGRDA